MEDPPPGTDTQRTSAVNPCSVQSDRGGCRLRGQGPCWPCCSGPQAPRACRGFGPRADMTRLTSCAPHSLFKTHAAGLRVHASPPQAAGLQQVKATCCTSGGSVYPAVGSAWLPTSLAAHSSYASRCIPPHSRSWRWRFSEPPALQAAGSPLLLMLLQRRSGLNLLPLYQQTTGLTERSPARAGESSLKKPTRARPQQKAELLSVTG